jgi:hypothetical protein
MTEEALAAALAAGWTIEEVTAWWYPELIPEPMPRPKAAGNSSTPT